MRERQPLLRPISCFPEAGSPFLKDQPGEKVREDKQEAGGAGSAHLLKDDIDVAGNELCDLLSLSRLY